MTYLSQRHIKVWVCTLLVGVFASFDAVAWGPRGRKAIAMASLQVIRRHYDDAFKANQTSYEVDLVRGAEDGFELLREYHPMHDDVQTVNAVFQEIQLMRTVRRYGTGSYFAYRMGVLSSLVSALMVPYGISTSEADRAIQARVGEDLDKMLDRFTFSQGKGNLEYLRAVETYFADKRQFYQSDKEIIGDEYRPGRSPRGFLREAGQTYFNRSVTTVSDVWYTVFRSQRDTTDISLSPVIVAEYFADEIEYLLSIKKNLRQAEMTYNTFREVNPPGNVEVYERIGDLFYAFGQETANPDALERGVKEWKLAYGHPGPQRARASKKLSEHYIEQGRNYYRKAEGPNSAEGDLESALRSFSDALEFDRNNDIAATSITETTNAIKERRDRFDMQHAIIDNALLGIREAENAALQEDYANALITYTQVLNGLSVVDNEFPELAQTAESTVDQVVTAQDKIYDDVMNRASQFIDEGNRAIDERRFEDAIGSFRMVDAVLSGIPAEAGSIKAERKTRMMEQAQEKIAEANDAKARAQQTPAPAPGGPVINP